MRHKHAGHTLYGTAKIGERGQIVIPKEARDEFDLNPGDLVIIVGKKGSGIGIAKATTINRFLARIFTKSASVGEEEE